MVQTPVQIPGVGIGGFLSADDARQAVSIIEQAYAQDDMEPGCLVPLRAIALAGALHRARQAPPERQQPAQAPASSSCRHAYVSQRPGCVHCGEPKPPS